MYRNDNKSMNLCCTDLSRAEVLGSDDSAVMCATVRAAWQSDSPVAGLVTLQSPCSVLLRGQAAAVNHTKLYTQSSSAVIRVGSESWQWETKKKTYTSKNYFSPEYKKKIFHWNVTFCIYKITCFVLVQLFKPILCILTKSMFVLEQIYLPIVS